jgi:hypothetical protein
MNIYIGLWMIAITFIVGSGAMAIVFPLKSVGQEALYGLMIVGMTALAMVAVFNLPIFPEETRAVAERETKPTDHLGPPTR